jgi:hypothetical protein
LAYETARELPSARMYLSAWPMAAESRWKSLLEYEMALQ